METKIESNGMYFNENTDKQVINVLTNALNSGRKLKFYYGKDGRTWREEHDTTGTIGRSTGEKKIPLLITSSRSYGGGAIMTDCIHRIIDFKTKQVLYSHKDFTPAKVEITASDLPEYLHNTIVDGKLYGRHKSLLSAQICASKMK